MMAQLAVLQAGGVTHQDDQARIDASLTLLTDVASEWTPSADQCKSIAKNVRDETVDEVNPATFHRTVMIYGVIKFMVGLCLVTWPGAAALPAAGISSIVLIGQSFIITYLRLVDDLPLSIEAQKEVFVKFLAGIHESPGNNYRNRANIFAMNFGITHFEVFWKAKSDSLMNARLKDATERAERIAERGNRRDDALDSVNRRLAELEKGDKKGKFSKDTTSAEMQALKDARHGGEPLPRLCVKALIGTCKDRNCPHPHREPVSKQHKQLLKAAFPRDLEAYVI